MGRKFGNGQFEGEQNGGGDAQADVANGDVDQ